MDQKSKTDLTSFNKETKIMIILGALATPIILSIICNLLFELVKGEKIIDFVAGTDRSYYKNKSSAMMIWMIFYFGSLTGSIIYLNKKYPSESKKVILTNFLTFIIIYNLIVAFINSIYILFASDPTPLYNY